MRRLGWLLIALLVSHTVRSFLTDAHALPLEPARLASELKMNPQTVRVRLSDLGKVMSIKGTHLALSLAKRPDLGNVSADEWVVDCKRSIIYQPVTGKYRRIPRSGVLFESLSGILSINQKHFREQIVVYPRELLSPYDSSQRANAECLVVNHVNVEKYLESVVNGEFNSQWAEAAVQAQVIAARSYALYQMKEMRKDRGRVFDVESNQKDQVYLGLDRVDSKGSEIVASTRGMILTPKNSRNLDPIKAFYHASCGGATTVPEKVWGSKFAGFTKKVPCPYCANSPSYNWQYEMSLNEMEAHIQKGILVDSVNRRVWPKAYASAPYKWLLVNVRTVAGVDSAPAPRGRWIAEAQAEVNDHRVKDFIFEFVKKDHSGAKLKVSMNAYQARNWLDPNRIKSTLFSIEKDGPVLVFHGHGSGHGVGLCQWGAKRMGEKGFTRDQILTHYYPGVKVVRLWN